MSILLRRLAALLPGLMTVVPALALAQVAGPLVELTQGNPNFDDLERAAATANQSVYNALLAADCDTGSPPCTQEQVAVFEETRELVETADELLGNPPGQNSLGLDEEGLGDALRWTAAEEVSSKGRVATDFSNGQASSATRRITALRYGATGFSIASVHGLPVADELDTPDGAALGPAGDGYDLSGDERWGGFLNAAYGWGEHDPTTFEDAFDYQSVDVTGGLDYRVLPELVLGVIGGYSENSIDFDGSKSIVDGGIDADGFSIGAFGLYEWKSVYFSGFLSYQRMEFDIDRFITYPSFNPDIPSTDTRTRGDTRSDALRVAANLGYTHWFGLGLETGPFSGEPFSLEPSVRVDYTDIRIHSYTETNVDPDEVFSLRIQEQDVESLEVALGLRGSFVLSTPLGVFLPYVRGEWIREFEDDTRTTSSQYSGAGPVSGLVPFRLDSEDIDTSYWTVAAGLQMLVVVLGPADETGAAPSRPISLYAEYRTVLDLDDISNDVIGAGVRLAF